MGYLSFIFLEVKFEVKFGAKPPDLLIWKYPLGVRPRRLGLPQVNSSLFEPVTLVYLSRQHGKSVMTCMLVLSGRVELYMVMNGGVKNKYEHLVNKLQIFRNSCLHIS